MNIHVANNHVVNSILQAFVFLVVLVYFNQGMPPVEKPFQVVEFFSGTGHFGKSCRFGCLMTAQLDIDMGQSLRVGSGTLLI